jgi:hypothetical protein
MAFEDDVLDISLLVTTDLSAAQYRFVKLSADNTVVICNGASDDAMGVLQNKPNGSVNTAVARVRVMGVSRVIAGGVIGFGDKVGTDGNGAGVAKTADTTKFVGIALDGAAGAGELATVFVQCGMRTISA